MDYEKFYTCIIEKARTCKRNKSKETYYEKHHIMPKCVGGTNNQDNVVLLTAKEHFVCHHLLTKIYTSEKLKFAFWAMCNQKNGCVERKYRVNATTYEKARISFAEANSKLHKGKTISDKQRKSCSEKLIGNTHHKRGSESHLYGIPRTEEHKVKISQTKLNNPERNASFKGYWITPYGTFASSKAAANICGLSDEVVRDRCRSSKQISKCAVSRNKDLSNKDVGATFKSLGWDFLPVS